MNEFYNDEGMDEAGAAELARRAEFLNSLPDGTEAIGVDPELGIEDDEFDEFDDAASIEQPEPVPLGDAWEAPLDWDEVAARAGLVVPDTIDEWIEAQTSAAGPAETVATETGEDEVEEVPSLSDSPAQFTEPTDVMPNFARLEAPVTQPDPDVKLKAGNYEYEPAPAGVGLDTSPFDRFELPASLDFDEAPMPNPAHSDRLRAAIAATAIRVPESGRSLDSIAGGMLCAPLPAGGTVMMGIKAAHRVDVITCTPDGGRREYVYKATAGGVFRLRHNSQAIRDSGSRPGELPLDMRLEEHKILGEHDKPNQDLARQLGLRRWEAVGEAELAHIERQLARAETSPIHLRTLALMAVNRRLSNIQPDRFAAFWAGLSFYEDMRQYAKTYTAASFLEIRDLPAHRVVSGDGAIMEVKTGFHPPAIEGHAPSPYVHIHYDEILNRAATARIIERFGLTTQLGHVRQGWALYTLRYERTEIDMTTCLTSSIEGTFYDMAGNELFTIYRPQPVTADKMEADALRHFLHHPYYFYNYYTGRYV